MLTLGSPGDRSADHARVEQPRYAVGFPCGFARVGDDPAFPPRPPMDWHEDCAPAETVQYRLTSKPAGALLQ